MILKDTSPVHVHTPKKIKMAQVSVCETETKEYKFVCKKCRLMDNIGHLVYGFD